MAYDFEKHGRPADGEIRRIWFADGRSARAKWTGIQFSLSPEGKRQTWPVHGPIWGSLEEIAEAHRAKAAYYLEKAGYYNAEAERIDAMVKES